ncbi:MAG: endonuclease/exonuclease/phosphatase family protein [Rubrivivax sp.]|nr:endonuclease/exonuclease/phosphatase family protein [Pyrinomonadaceae bacterium]
MPGGNCVLTRIILTFAQTAFAGVLLLTAAGMFGLHGKYLELASHFRLQYLLAAAVCLPLFIALKSWPWAALDTAYVLAVTALLLPSYLSRQTEESQQASTHSLRLLLSNVNYENTRYAELASLIESESPDVIVLQEVTTGWLDALKPSAARYPFTRWRAEETDGSGIALLSRIPFEESDVAFVGRGDRPGIVARLRVGGAPLSLFAIHPHAPLRPKHFGYRNEQLLAAAEQARSLPAPKIFVGDLNTTPWSPYFGRVLAESGMVDARKGFGLLPTWPVWNRTPLLMLPLDHCFVSPDIRIENIRTGPNIGSDHLPVIIDLALPVTAKRK